MNNYIAKTERLCLSLLSLNDTDDYYEIKGDIRVTSAYSMNAYSKERSDLKLKSLIDDNGISSYSIGVHLKSTGKLIGTLCLYNFKNNIAELGYEFNYSYHHMGYAFESVKAYLTYIANTHVFSRIVASTESDNISSAHLLLKCGFIFDRSVIEDNIKYLHYYLDINQEGKD